MSTGIVADKYSSAILALAQEQNILLQMEEDLIYVNTVINEHQDLRQFLVNPIMAVQDKIELLGKIFESSISKIALHFLYVMVKRGRYSLIQESIRSFITKSRKARGILEAHVTVTEPLSETIQRALTNNLKAMTGHDIMLTFTEDPSIIGGLIIQIGDQVIDSSVARRLVELEKSLINIDKIG